MPFTMPSHAVTQSTHRYLQLFELEIFEDLRLLIALLFEYRQLDAEVGLLVGFAFVDSLR